MFRFSEGAQSPPSLFFSHVSGIVGQFFRDVSTMVHVSCVHIHGDDLVAPVVALTGGGVLGAEYWVCGSLGWHLVIMEPKPLGPFLLGGSRSSLVVSLGEPSIFELFVDGLVFPGFLPPVGQHGGCGYNVG